MKSVSNFESRNNRQDLFFLKNSVNYAKHSSSSSSFIKLLESDDIENNSSKYVKPSSISDSNSSFVEKIDETYIVFSTTSRRNDMQDIKLGISTNTLGDSVITKNDDNALKLVNSGNKKKQQAFFTAKKTVQINSCDILSSIFPENWNKNSQSAELISANFLSQSVLRLAGKKSKQVNNAAALQNTTNSSNLHTVIALLSVMIGVILGLVVIAFYLEIFTVGIAVGVCCFSCGATKLFVIIAAILAILPKITESKRLYPPLLIPTKKKFAVVSIDVNKRSIVIK
ncbi:MAG: hypothetical protein LKM44_01185 [Wolbachia endosymbiont of Meromenopon meropis]|nr:hypothetical protein [Wolbachia endosymbiont of Meromenopon meropis]